MKLFGWLRDASLKELIVGFILTCQEAVKKDNYLQRRLNFDKKGNVSRLRDGDYISPKKHSKVIDSLGLENLVNYIENDDIAFVENEIEES